MKVKDLISQLQEVGQESEVVLQIDKGYATIGGTPQREVESISEGFDWNHGQVFLLLKDGAMLTEVSKEDYQNHIRYKSLVMGMRGREDIRGLSDIFVRKEMVLGRLQNLLDRLSKDAMEIFEISDLIYDIEKEELP